MRSKWKKIFPDEGFSFLFLFFFFLGSLPKIKAGDLWWHLKTSAWDFQHHQLLRKEIFSFTAQGAEWIRHEWFAEGIYYLGYLWDGFAGVIFIRALLVGILLALSYQWIRFKTRSTPWALFCIPFLIYHSQLSWNDRPYLFSYAGWILYLFIEDRFDRDCRSKSFRFLPLLFLFWANLHGGFILALGLLGGSTLLRWGDKERFRTSLRVFLTSLAAVCLNPSGIFIFSFLFGYAGGMNVHKTFISEFKALNFNFFPFIEIILFFTFFLFIRKGFSKDWRHETREFLSFAAFTHIALVGVRFVYFLPFVVLPIIAGLIASLYRRRTKTSFPEITPPAWKTAIFVFILTISAVHFFGKNFWAEKPYFYKNLMPQKAVAAALENHWHGNYISELYWGGYLIAKGSPKIKVFVDGRTDVYGYKILKDYDTIRLCKPGWKKVLNHYPINFLLFSPKRAIIRNLKNNANWLPLYSDSVAVLLKRNS